MQQFAVSQKKRTKAITVSAFSLSLFYRTGNKRFLTLRCTKTVCIQPKLNAACFAVQSCLADADFAFFSNYSLIGTRQILSFFTHDPHFLPLKIKMAPAVLFES